MSWQRILGLARQQGFPVIVTDIAGREPMVVLPLGEYERLTNLGSGRTAGMPPSIRSGEPISMQRTEDSKILIEDIANAREEMPPSASMPENTGSSRDLSLEERFYLEPVDEENRPLA